MAILYNLTLFLIYGAATAWIVLFTAQKLPTLPPSFSMGLGAGILFMAGAIHELMLRRCTVKKALHDTKQELEYLKTKQTPRTEEPTLQTPPSSEASVVSTSTVEVFDPDAHESRMVEALVEQISDTHQEEALQAHGDLEQESAERMLSTVKKALHQDKVELYLQPIVSLPQRKKQFFECFSRIRDESDELISPDDYLGIARKAGLVAAIDNLLFFRCIQLLRRALKKNPNVSFFCNVSEETIDDEEFFTDFVGYLEENQDLASHLIFEMSQQTFRKVGDGSHSNLLRLQQIGCRFSIDQVTDLHFNPEELAAQRVKFIKLDSEFLLDLLRREEAPLDFGALKGALDRVAMDLIVEKISSDSLLLELLDYQIDFGQGYLFGEPQEITLD